MSDNTKNSLQKLSLTAIIVVIVLVTVFLVLSFIYTGDTIRKGIKIGDTDVSWMSYEEARTAVNNDLMSRYAGDSITFVRDSKQWLLWLTDIDYRYLVDEEIEKAYSIGRNGNIFKKVYNALLLSIKGNQLNIESTYRRDKLEAFIKKIKKEIDSDARNATISYENGNIDMKKSNIGVKVDVAKNLEIAEYYIKQKKFGIIELVVEETIPHILYDEIKEISSELSSYKTSFNINDRNRTDNIRLAAKRLDNRILLPGESFSMNESLGPRTLENGYKEAPIMLKSELVMGTGGGICQVSSTLYNAVLLSGLDVIERVHHSAPLSYISAGRDATVNEDSIDFRFVNSLDYPICIQADVEGKILTVRILGRKPKDGKTYKIKTETLAIYPPGDDEVVFDNTLAIGERIVERKPIKGIRVALYRETYINGKLQKREKLTEDYYKPVKGKVKVNKYTFDAQNQIKEEQIN